jgi:putative transposase
LIQRAQHGQSPFAEAADRESYLKSLRDAAGAHRVAIHAYGLTQHEVRLLATPDDARALSQMIQAIGRRFVAEFNRRHQRSGSLWQGRFRATVVDPAEHLMDCMRFVEAAPDAGGAEHRHDDAMSWTSAWHHTGAAVDPLITEHPGYWAIGNTPFERESAYRKILEHALTPEQWRQIGSAALKGWVLGSERFAKKLGTQATRRMRPLTRGRPRKNRPPIGSSI